MARAIRPPANWRRSLRCPCWPVVVWRACRGRTPTLQPWRRRDTEQYLRGGPQPRALPGDSRGKQIARRRKVTIAAGGLQPALRLTMKNAVQCLTERHYAAGWACFSAPTGQRQISVSYLVSVDWGAGCALTTFATAETPCVALASGDAGFGMLSMRTVTMLG